MTNDRLKLYWFSEMPHHEWPEGADLDYPSMRLTFPNTFFSPEKAARNYQHYFDEHVLADEVGFDGLMINEHHSTPSCSDVSIMMSAAILARTTKRAKIALMGNILPIQDNPVMVAEQIAMADLISGGRIISGFVRGIGVETWWANANPVHNRERFEECHDLIIKCWTEPGPFRWEGQHYHFRHVNPWVLPLQKPHPPIWVPGTASPETALWAGKQGYTYVPFLVPIPIARELFDYYRQGAAETGREVTPDKLGFLLCAVTGDSEAEAREAGRFFEWRMGPTTRGPVEYFAPPGIRTRAGQRMALRTRPRNMATMTYEEKVENDLIVAGTPEYLVDRFDYFKRELGIGHLLLQGHESRMTHKTTMRSIELMGTKVIPNLSGT
jgi:alkanesulfonate monooxygenase SsuD/methylene tetrahydromethanopterin reductase-like flavin-dependent oxidoreductase (luciferase family)